MANTAQGKRDTSLVTVPVTSATVIDQGDQIYWDKTNSLAKPYSDITDQGTEPLNQVLAAGQHLGIAHTAAPDGEDSLVVDIGRTVTVYDVTVPSATYRFGTLLGPSEASSGTALEDQQLEAVTLLEEATHVVMDDSASARTRVACTQIKSSIPGLSGVGAGKQGVIQLPLFGWQEADGTALAIFADGASAVPGFSLTDAEALCIRWNNHANPDPIGISFVVPADADVTKDFNLMALCSKTGATVGDATTLTVTAFNTGVVGALHDADADYGGTSDALTGDATAKTVAKLTLALAAANLPAFPAAISLTVQPTDGLLGTDDFCLHAVWIEYTKLA